MNPLVTRAVWIIVDELDRALETDVLLDPGPASTVYDTEMPLTLCKKGRYSLSDDDSIIIDDGTTIFDSNSILFSDSTVLNLRFLVWTIDVTTTEATGTDRTVATLVVNVMVNNVT